MIKARVVGLRELGETMNKLPPEMLGKNGGNIIAKAMRAGAVLIRDAAIANAPKDSGNLADNIIAKRNPDPPRNREEVYVGVRRGKSRKSDKARGKGAYYFHFLEFGTEKQSAQPFLRPAFESQKNAALTAIVDRLRKLVENAVRRVARGKVKRGR